MSAARLRVGVRSCRRLFLDAEPNARMEAMASLARAGRLRLKRDSFSRAERG